MGPTCDSFDKVSLHENLRANLECGDLLYTVNIGACSSVSASHFNGFPPAKVVHINTRRSTSDLCNRSSQLQPVIS